MLTKTLTLISHFSKRPVPLEIGLQHISASAPVKLFEPAVELTQIKSRKLHQHYA
ncbi:hypothetical protein LC613_40965 [Nostoc sphaeroides CHAB 2801]|uniref:hypothetical protein n=1 Tax=Nostoc sphaeroides TaxID=446679 RepID=UPI001E471453|nr:hypothetical protein [Nostoc sphaeroides]MCC5633792.1 hypothetical protein [Nostoc sphaeroides CHAB 2801]